MAADVQTVLGTFAPSLFVPTLVSKNKDGILKELVSHVSAAGLVRDADPLLEMLRNRERLGSTGIGHGIAVPHGRSLAVQHLVAGFAKHKRGVEWDALDGEPVHLIFFIIAPPIEQPNRYLPFLGRVVETVNDPERRARLLQVETFLQFQEFLRDALS